MARLITSSVFQRPLDLVVEEKGLLDPEALASLRSLAARTGNSFEKVFVNSSGLSEIEIFQALAEYYNLPLISTISQYMAFEDLPDRLESVCLNEKIVVISHSDTQLVVATAQPGKVDQLTSLLSALGFNASFNLALPSEIMALLPIVEEDSPDHELFTGISSLASSLKDATGTAGMDDDKTSDISLSSDLPTVVQLVNKTLMLAVNQNASDIHIDSTQLGARIRFRIDGVLADRLEVDINTAASFFSRLLIMARLDITEKHMPQDGSFKVRCDKAEVEFRIACMPGIHGQNIVLRILSGAEMVKLGLDNSGMLDDELQIVKSTTRYPHGMVLVAGPTGSGKSTTLYSLLEDMADPKMKFVTIEDPVERRITGVQQIQVRVNRNEPERSLTFARGLRTILRLDPDIILVGEIRDAETAQIAVQASLTGHLVLSTIHANSSVETLRRLENIGIDFHLLMSSLNLIFAQRLMRRLCPECKQGRQPTSPEARVLRGYEHGFVFLPRGCPSCLNMGYRGRAGIFEFLEITDLIRDMIAQKGLTENIKFIRESRLRTLFESALLKVANGESDFGELERVCGPCL